MIFILNWLLPLTLAAMLGSGIAQAAGAPHDDDVERAELVMGTVARVVLPVRAARAAFRDVDRAMSLYRPESELSRVNTYAADHPEPVGDALFALLARARAL